METRLQSRHVPSCLHGASWRSAFVGFPYGDVIIGLALTGLFALSFTGAWFQAPIYGCPSPFPCGLPPGSAPEVCALMLVDQPCARGFPFGSLWEGTGLLPAVASVAALMFFVLRRMPRIELVRPISSVIGIIVAVIEVAVLLVSGVEPALLLAASVVLFLALRAVRVENIPAASESAVWMAFAAVESAFLDDPGRPLRAWTGCAPKRPTAASRWRERRHRGISCRVRLAPPPETGSIRRGVIDDE